MTINNQDRTIRPTATGQGESEGFRMRMASALIVDDEPEIRNILQRGLQKYFSLVETAEDSDSAENLRQRCHFDLIIADIRLPGLNGVDWVSALRNQGATTCVIFMTAHANVELAISALRLGVEDFILKPFRIEQMMTAVERYLQRQKSQQRIGKINALFHLKTKNRTIAELPITRVVDLKS